MMSGRLLIFGAQPSSRRASSDEATRRGASPARRGPSFTTIGFQTDGKSVKFVITQKAPGVETADRNDPYGETGFMSIKWYYGFMALRPERVGLIKTVAKL